MSHLLIPIEYFSRIDDHQNIEMNEFEEENKYKVLLLIDYQSNNWINVIFVLFFFKFDIF